MFLVHCSTQSLTFKIPLLIEESYSTSIPQDIPALIRQNARLNVCISLQGSDHAYVLLICELVHRSHPMVLHAVRAEIRYLTSWILRLLRKFHMVLFLRSCLDTID